MYRARTGTELLHTRQKVERQDPTEAVSNLLHKAGTGRSAHPSLPHMPLLPHMTLHVQKRIWTPILMVAMQEDKEK